MTRSLLRTHSPTTAAPLAKFARAFCAAVPNLTIMETDIDRIGWDAEIFTHLPEFQDGYLILPDRPGWGTEPIEAALADHPPVPGAGMWQRTEASKLSV